MAANALSHRPPIGFFRRFVQEDDGTQSEGLNLKHRGIVPITTWSGCAPWKRDTRGQHFRRIELAWQAGDE